MLKTITTPKSSFLYIVLTIFLVLIIIYIFISIIIYYNVLSIQNKIINYIINIRGKQDREGLWETDDRGVLRRID